MSRPKKTVKAEVETVEPVANGVEQDYSDVIAKLRAGKALEGYTLVPSNAANTNTTVVKVMDVEGTDLALCAYK